MPGIRVRSASRNLHEHPCGGGLVRRWGSQSQQREEFDAPACGNLVQCEHPNEAQEEHSQRQRICPCRKSSSVVRGSSFAGRSGPSILGSSPGPSTASLSPHTRAALGTKGTERPGSHLQPTSGLSSTLTPISRG